MKSILLLLLLSSCVCHAQIDSARYRAGAELMKFNKTNAVIPPKTCELCNLSAERCNNWLAKQRHLCVVNVCSLRTAGCG
jgi:hypothetical protein